MQHDTDTQSTRMSRSPQPEETDDSLFDLPCDSRGGCSRTGVWAITVQAPCCSPRPTTWLACDRHLGTFLARTDQRFRHCGEVFTMRDAIVRIDKV